MLLKYLRHYVILKIIVSQSHCRANLIHEYRRIPNNLKIYKISIYLSLIKFQWLQYCFLLFMLQCKIG
jgi:hypothetical protein